jgi:hypothetical protein
VVVGIADHIAAVAGILGPGAALDTLCLGCSGLACFL